MKLSYYPGCSLKSSAVEFNLSAQAACQAAGLELVELEDWSCCGATSAHSTNHLLSLGLPARNIKLAQEKGMDLVVPCSACYNRLKLTDHTLRQDPQERKKIEELTDFKYTGEVQVLSLLEAIVERVGLKNISAKVSRPLKGLKIASYYGCLLLRPLCICNFDNPENPIKMDSVVAALGAEPVEWSYKTDCCGASHGLSRAETAFGLSSNIIDMAGESGAQALVTTCPLCYSNLEMRRRPEQNLPVFFVTELMGLAFGLPQSMSWMKKHLVDPQPILTRLALA